MLANDLVITLPLDGSDLRSLASAAKVVAELEKLLTIPNIQGIQLVQQNVATIKSFGSNIRMLAQAKLLEATAEKNQAAMAHYLQVFFNLDSLPEILLLTVDQTVRLAADASKDALQLDVLAGVFHDYVHKQGGNNAAGAPPSATKRSVSTTALSTSTSSTSAAQPVTLSQLRLAMREITHAWSTVIFERATQMLILQRVIAKKEDPLTHVKFRDVLREKAATAKAEGGSHQTNGTETTTASAALLANGQIVALFWQRLSNALHDICAEKLRHHPAEVVCRLYPYLRRAAQDVLTQMQSWSDDVSNPATLLSSTASMAGGASSTLSFLNDGEWTIEQLLAMDVPASPFQQDLAALETLWANDNQVLGMFGSSMWHEDITRFRPNPAASSTATGMHSLVSANGEEASTKLLKSTMATSSALTTAATAAATSASSSSSSSGSKEADLVQGLQPIRDRFLLAVLDRMQHPISQMFPDLDGYVAAIPSKRDLLTLIRAIQLEYVTVATESTDLSFIGLVNREFLKTVRLMLTKMEGMIISSGADVRRIATTASGSGAGASANAASHHSLANGSGTPSFVRTAPQDHNAQCFVLLGQLREALQKLPMQVIQHLDDPAAASGLDGGSKDLGKTPLKTPSTVPDSSRKAVGGANEGGSSNSSSGTGTIGGSGNSIFVDNVLREITRATEQACAELDDLASRHIVEPLLSLLTEYSLTILSQLHRESVITSQGQSKTAAGNKGGSDTMDLTIENSLAVQALVRQLPVLLKTYLFSLPKFTGSSLLDDAGEELANRLLMLYMSLASMSRPMTEAVRLRTAKDLSALEMLLSQQFPHVSSSQKHSPVMREFRYVVVACGCVYLWLTVCMC